MGQEAMCVVRMGRRKLAGTALLETAEVRFRGDVRLKLPFAGMKSVTAKDGVLRVVTDDATYAFELGPLAAKWLEKIKNPKPVIDKLGVKPGLSVAVIGVDNPAFLRQVKERAASVTPGRVPRGSHLVFFGATAVPALGKLASFEKSIARDGGIWVVWPKGRKELTEDHVRAAAKRAGLTDVKVVAFSPTHSALKLVIPLARR
jgi:hypothetical protein